MSSEASLSLKISLANGDKVEASTGVASKEASPKQEWSVESTLSSLPTSPTPNLQSPIPFLHLIERLKTTPREGWRRFGVSHGESISDHMYRMSIMTMLAPPSLSSRLDIPHCTKMALVHDMAESLVGDITPVDHVEKPEKSRRESTTMDYLCSSLLGVWGGGDQGNAIRAIWQEYEDGRSLESMFVHDVDKMELLLQMVEYERRKEPKGALDLGEFARVARGIKLEEVKVWAREVLKEREDFWKGIENSKATFLEIGKEI